VIVGAAWLAALLAGDAVGSLTQHTRVLDVYGFLAAALCIWALVRHAGVGAWYGVLLLAAVNALPGPNLDTLKLSALYGTDFAALLLVASMFVEHARDAFRPFRVPGYFRMAAQWGAGFFVLWAITVARSWAFSGIPLAHALEFGRAFAFFALLVPLFAASLAQQRTRNALLAVCGVGALVVAITQAVVILHGGGLSFVVHVYATSSLVGLTRLYSNATYLVVAAMPFAVGGVLLGKSARMRVWSGLVAVATTVDIALLLTRALYVAVVVGIGAASLCWLAISRRDAVRGRRRLARLGLGLAVIGGLIAVIQPPAVSTSAVNGVAVRFTSIFSTITSSNAQASTLAERDQESATLESILGSRWPIGLGFLDPRNRYFVGLPAFSDGSIMNSDVGILNVVMTMGVLGAAIQLMPLLFVAWVLWMQRVTKREEEADAWLTYGVFAWAVLAITSCVTLVMLFSVDGVAVSAAVLGLGVAMAGRTRSRRFGT
jgi:hypothetical protein